MKLSRIVFLASACWLAPTALLAHTDLAASNPGDGAVSNESPEAIELSFTEDVRLLKLSITGTADREVTTGFKPSAVMQKAFEVAVPELEQGTYTINWGAMGSDSHLVEKSFSFTVDANAAETAGTAPLVEESHAVHAHCAGTERMPVVKSQN